MELTMRILPDGFFYFFWESEVGQRRRRVGQPWGRLDGGMQSDVMVFCPTCQVGVSRFYVCASPVALACRPPAFPPSFPLDLYRSGLQSGGHKMTGQLPNTYPSRSRTICYNTLQNTCLIGCEGTCQNVCQKVMPEHLSDLTISEHKPEWIQNTRHMVSVNG